MGMCFMFMSYIRGQHTLQLFLKCLCYDFLCIGFWVCKVMDKEGCLRVACVCNSNPVVVFVCIHVCMCVVYKTDLCTCVCRMDCADVITLREAAMNNRRPPLWLLPSFVNHLPYSTCPKTPCKASLC